MKIPNFKFRIANFRRRDDPAGHSPLVIRHSPFERGIALVITLIMLAVTLVMAVAFLAIARRERNASTTATDTAVARLATDAGLAAAQAQIAANILTGNPYNYGLLVSTNYQNGYGFDPTAGSNPTNVNYDYLDAANGNGSVLGANLVQNIANLYLLPRAPVYVNNPNTGSNDFRYFLDLNRNGQFDGNGPQPQVDSAGLFIHTDGTADSANPVNVATNVMVGDPEWIGVLEHPDQPHSPNNPFVARYAFLAQPAGNALDLNYIHNQTKSSSMPNPFNAGNDGYFRNESVGSWELNLAAFFADLNTNEWNTVTAPYIYDQPKSANGGSAFYDAQSLLAWRYAYNYNSLAIPPASLYNGLVLVGIDGYTVGNLMTNTSLPVTLAPPNGIITPWAGSDNPNRFFALPSDVFDTSKTAVGVVGTNFTQRLQMAGNGVSTYDRYTYYRLLDELGTDSTADDSRMNLNYDNLDANGNVVPGWETNCVPWTPLGFFTNAANRMLTYYSSNWIAANYNAFTNTFGSSVSNAFGVANIPVYVNGQMVYSPAVNRILQLAANMYDATTNTSGIPANYGHDFPSVFRPTFWVTNQNGFKNVYVNGYQYIASVTNNNDPVLNYVTNVTDLVTGNVTRNVFGVPWIIGAKKGYPNFNEFAMENTLAVTRRLQLTRAAINPPDNVDFSTFHTNQMYTMSLNSSIGIELWNSYISNYSGSIVVDVNEAATLMITNDDRNVQNPLFMQTFTTNFPSAPVVSWAGSGTGLAYGTPATASFKVPIFVGPSLTNSAYRSSYADSTTVPAGFIAPGFVPTNYFNVNTGTVKDFETNSPNGFHFPQFGVVLTNRLQVFMLDYTNNIYHVIDYVSFAGPDGGFNVNLNLADADNNGGVQQNYGVWNTNYPDGSAAPNGVTQGILSQLALSASGDTPPTEDGNWKSDTEASALGTTVAQQAASFQGFVSPGNIGFVGGLYATNLLLTVQAPYSPTRNIVQYFSWQANDPLVHYLASDIASPPPTPNTTTIPQVGVNHYDPGQTVTPLGGLNLGQLNDNYMPWGGNPKYGVVPGDQNFVTTNQYNLEVKDPLVKQSDNWDFPSYKFPTVGWLGRVHRGTPWQTVYLKASDFLANNNYAAWQAWTGDQNIFDATNSAPVQDAGLFDLFTAVPAPNATHGTLSVNQTNLAAWSAVFSGLVVPDNLTGGYTNIPPAGSDTVNSAVAKLVNGINTTRANAGLFPGAFTHVGDIVRTPALTEQSPFLAGLDPNTQRSDELYEWLPQQTLGLLRASSTPRYVVYCYGQTLRPAPGGKVLDSGPYFDMVTNYQITAESAARAVIRVDNATTAPRVVVESYVPLPPK
jgi:hypothetical protein